MNAASLVRILISSFAGLGAGVAMVIAVAYARATKTDRRFTGRLLAWHVFVVGFGYANISFAIVYGLTARERLHLPLDPFIAVPLFAGTLAMAAAMLIILRIIHCRGKAVR